MSRPICSDRGMSLVEVVIATFLVSVGVLAILSLQPSAWRSVGKSDYLGRAAGILSEELQRQEALLMNPNYSPSLSPATRVVRASGLGTTVAGDAEYTVATDIDYPVGSSGTLYRVTVTVTWANQAANNYRNVQESILVSPQNVFWFAGTIVP